MKIEEIEELKQDAEKTLRKMRNYATEILESAEKDFNDLSDSYTRQWDMTLTQ